MLDQMTNFILVSKASSIWRRIRDAQAQPHHMMVSPFSLFSAISAAGLVTVIWSGNSFLKLEWRYIWCLHCAAKCWHVGGHRWTTATCHWWLSYQKPTLTYSNVVMIWRIMSRRMDQKPFLWQDGGYRVPTVNVKQTFCLFSIHPWGFTLTMSFQNNENAIKV